jgi:hypothetical protein
MILVRGSPVNACRSLAQVEPPSFFQNLPQSWHYRRLSALAPSLIQINCRTNPGVSGRYGRSVVPSSRYFLPFGFRALISTRVDLTECQSSQSRLAVEPTLCRRLQNGQRANVLIPSSISWLRYGHANSIVLSQRMGQPSLAPWKTRDLAVRSPLTTRLDWRKQ